MRIKIDNELIIDIIESEYDRFFKLRIKNNNFDENEFKNIILNKTKNNVINSKPIAKKENSKLDIHTYIKILIRGFIYSEYWKLMKN